MAHFMVRALCGDPFLSKKRLLLARSLGALFGPRVFLVFFILAAETSGNMKTDPH